MTAVLLLLLISAPQVASVKTVTSSRAAGGAASSATRRAATRTVPSSTTSSKTGGLSFDEEMGRPGNDTVPFGDPVTFTSASQQQFRSASPAPIISPSQPLRRRRRRGQWQTTEDIFLYAVAAISGLSNVLCFYSYGFYANMMTGNTIRSVLALAEGRFQDSLFYATVVTCYTFGTALRPWLSSRFQPQITPAVMFFLFVLADVTGFAFQIPRASPVLLAMAFGLTNAVSLSNNNVVAYAATGHWTKIGGALGSGSALPSNSVKFFASFIVSLFVSTVLYKRIVEPLGWKQLPIGTIVGSGLTLTLSWYQAQEKQRLAQQHHHHHHQHQQTPQQPQQPQQPIVHFGMTTIRKNA